MLFPAVPPNIGLHFAIVLPPLPPFEEFYLPGSIPTRAYLVTFFGDSALLSFLFIFFSQVSHLIDSFRVNDSSSPPLPSPVSKSELFDIVIQLPQPGTFSSIPSLISPNECHGQATFSYSLHHLLL